jgi:hypothetical protein
MYESPHPPHAVTASDAPAHFLGIDWSGIDWYTCAVAIVAIAVVVFIMRSGGNRRRAGGSDAGDFSGTSDLRTLRNDISWGPGDHASIGSDAGHHGGFFDGGGGDAGGGGHL